MIFRNLIQGCREYKVTHNRLRRLKEYKNFLAKFPKYNESFNEALSRGLTPERRQLIGMGIPESVFKGMRLFSDLVGLQGTTAMHEATKESLGSYLSCSGCG